MGTRTSMSGVNQSTLDTIFYSDSQQFIPKSAFTFKIYEFIPKHKENYLTHQKNIFSGKEK